MNLHPLPAPVDIRHALSLTPQYAGDPWSTEGTHRQSWSLSGWELTGRTVTGQYVYVLRFDVNGTRARTFAAATVNAGKIDGIGASFATLHRSDYDGGCTLQQARDTARTLTRA